MFKPILRMLVLSALTLLPLTSWAVTNTVAGACYPGAQFTTIQDAVNAASVGATVRVCPGTYPEQVVIEGGKNLTLTGIGLGADAVIVPPGTGFATTGNLGNGPIASQILVQDATVTISNIAVDGGGQRSCLAAGQWIGVLYVNAGGNIKNMAVRNGPYCAGTTGIYAQNPSNLKILNNSLHDCIDCISLTGATNSTITGNLVVQGGIVPPFWGVDVRNSPGPTVISSNLIGSMQIAGVYVLSSPNVSITNNTIPASPSGLGIYLVGATTNTVQNNRISNALQGIAIDDQGKTGQNIANHNTIVDSNCGLAVGLTLNDNVSPNVFYTTTAGYCLNPPQ